MDIHSVIERLGNTADARAQVFGPGDSSALLALEMREAVQQLVNEVIATLEDNRHLADGDNCTLLRLKRAVGWT